MFNSYWKSALRNLLVNRFYSVISIAGLSLGLAAFILLMRLVDMYYLIGPNPRIDMHGLERGAFMFSWMDIVAPIAIGGFWLWVFFGELMKRPLVPVMDPFLDRAINHGKGH